MDIGYLLLEVALAAVALWLVAELLLQQRAPVLWRALALVGFLGVVAGMRLGSVLVIGAGAAGFAAGQILVTRSVKRGFTGGWSLRRSDGSLPGPLARVPLLSAATGGETPPAPLPDPVGEVGPVESEPLAPPHPEPPEELTSYDAGYVPEQAVYYQPEPEHYQQEQYSYPYADQQWPQQQPAFAYEQTYPTQQQYQDPYGGPQYQETYAQSWDHQQQYSNIPAQPTYDYEQYQYQHQQWDHQQG